MTNTGERAGTKQPPKAALEVVEVAIDDLRPDPANPRRISDAQLEMKLIAIVDNGGEWVDFPEFDFEAHPDRAHDVAKQLVKTRFNPGCRLLRVVDAENRAHALWEARPGDADEIPLWAAMLMLPGGVLWSTLAGLLALFLADNGLLILGLLPLVMFFSGIVITLTGIGMTVGWVRNRLRDVRA